MLLLCVKESLVQRAVFSSVCEGRPCIDALFFFVCEGKSFINALGPPGAFERPGREGRAAAIHSRRKQGPSRASFVPCTVCPGQTGVCGTRAGERSPLTQADCFPAVAGKSDKGRDEKIRGVVCGLLLSSAPVFGKRMVRACFCLRRIKPCSKRGKASACKRTCFIKALCCFCV